MEYEQEDRCTYFEQNNDLRKRILIFLRFIEWRHLVGQFYFYFILIFLRTKQCKLMLSYVLKNDVNFSQQISRIYFKPFFNGSVVAIWIPNTSTSVNYWGRFFLDVNKSRGCTRIMELFLFRSFYFRDPVYTERQSSWWPCQPIQTKDSPHSC